MSKVTVKIDMSYSDLLVMDSLKAQALLELIVGAEVVERKYAQEKYVIKSPVQVNIETMGTRCIVTEEEFNADAV